MQQDRIRAISPVRKLNAAFGIHRCPTFAWLLTGSTVILITAEGKSMGHESCIEVLFSLSNPHLKKAQN